MTDIAKPIASKPPTSVGRWVWLIMLLWMAWVYHGALNAGFFLDDEVTILLNESVAHLGTSLRYAMIQDRGLVTLSFAMNHVMHGVDPWGYHLVNLVVHYLNGLLLYALLSRILRLPRIGMNPNRATWLALAGSMVWLIHPFGSQAVIYLSQRSELMASCMYLLCAYALVRSVDCPTRSKRWQVLCVISCLLGMQCKLICVTIPLLLLALDWLVVVSSFSEIWQRRRWLYLGLFATWGMIVVTGMLGMLGSDTEHASAGAGLSEIISPTLYLAAQSGVILHYLKLSIWPSVLVFDYAWPAPSSLWDSTVTLTVMVMLFGATLGLVATKVRWSILPLGVFLILAPTSSFVPVIDLAVEHRMYLALACICVGVLLLLGRVLKRYPHVMVALCVILVVALSVRTWVRVGDYENATTLWRTVLNVYPKAPRARFHFDVAGLMQQGLGKRIDQLQEAIALDDNDAQSRYVLGEIYVQIQKFKLARPLLEKSLAIDPGNVDCQLSLAQLDRFDGRLLRAEKLYRQVLKSRPDDFSALVGYVELLAGLQKWDQALTSLDNAMLLKPDDVSLMINRANVLLRADRFEEALVSAKQAYERSGENASTYSVLASAYAANGQWVMACDLFEKMLGEYPDHPGALQRLAWLYATCPKPTVRDGQKALEYARAFFSLTGGANPTAWDTMAAAWAREGQFNQAISAMHKAISRLRDVGRDDMIPAYQQRLEQYQQHQSWTQDSTR